MYDLHDRHSMNIRYVCHRLKMGRKGIQLQKGYDYRLEKIYQAH